MVRHGTGAGYGLAVGEYRDRTDRLSSFAGFSGFYVWLARGVAHHRSSRLPARSHHRALDEESPGGCRAARLRSNTVVYATHAERQPNRREPAWTPSRRSLR